MPRRKITFVSGEYYHLYNRSIFREPIFSRKQDVDFFLNLIEFYILNNPPVKYSYYRRNKNKYTINYEDRIATIISYCFMPNHFHLCVRQEKNNGIHLFMKKILNSYSHYFRLKYKGKGPLFESMFKAVHIETEEQLIHLSRYIHLNPVSSNLVKKPEQFQYSSFNLYLSEPTSIYDFEPVLSKFKNINKYKEFVEDNINYQKGLERIKHLIFE